MDNERNKRLASIMGLCWHEADYMLDGKWDKNCLHYYVPCRKCKLVLYSPDKTVYNPDFSTPEWRAKLMDWAVEQWWYQEFDDWADDEWVKCAFRSDIQTDHIFTRHLWRNLATLIVEYHGEER